MSADMTTRNSKRNSSYEREKVPDGNLDRQERMKRPQNSKYVRSIKHAVFFFFQFL